MILTTSNILLNVEPAITAGASSDDPASITDPDFSSSYQSSDNSTLAFDFGMTPELSYVALAGLNIATSASQGRIRIYDGVTLVSTSYIDRNHCSVITFAAQTFTNLIVEIHNPLGSPAPICRFVAGGDYITVPLGGESAGYNRHFLNRNNKTKSTLNNWAAPTTVLTKKTSPAGTLSLPNMTKVFSETIWQDFLDFTVLNYFFIQEQQTSSGETNNTAYMAFDLSKSQATSHAQTRGLNNLSIKFRVFNGL
jgi:hypothetical protein